MSRDTPTGALSNRELEAWRGMLEVHRELVGRLDEELERRHGLPLSSYEVLLHLGEADGERLRMGELADRLLLSRSGLTRLVDRLERHGWVRRSRCPGDARGLFAELTEAGRGKLDAARPDHLAGVRAHFLDRLDGEEQSRLGEIWTRLRAPLADAAGDRLS